MHINFHKSKVLRIGLTQAHTDQVARILDSESTDFSLMYLGMPLRYDKLKTADWTLLTEKITKKLAGWKGKLLSFAGRVTFLNTVISPIVMFWMANFIRPSNITKIIEKSRRSFF